MKLKSALMLAFSLACLNEATYEFMSRYDAWIIGVIIIVASGVLIYSIRTSRK